MSKKEDFKNFVLTKPELVEYVENNKTTWQKLFEIYDLYGENNDIWKKYEESRTIHNSIDLKGIINQLKNINLDSLEENITQVQKVVDLVSEFTKKEEKETIVNAKEEKIDKLYGDESEN
jgi:predicted nucleic acid-binding protein